MEKVLVGEIASVPAGTDAAELPERVQEELGALAGAAKEGCWRCRSESGWSPDRHREAPRRAGHPR